ncbi:MAG: TonB-dependent receptor plug domain-containing protein, partial [Chitinophagaceae bacterium]|nr:TonB-dependent receptor plug domain-containing protein [Chitinophagaceae bacterium]
MLLPKLHCTFPVFILFAAALFSFPLLISAQPLNGRLTGKIIDGSNGHTLLGCNVSKVANGKPTNSASDGTYSLLLSEGLHRVQFQMTGFQTKIIQKIEVRNKAATYLDIVLFPLAGLQRFPSGYKNDSLPPNDSIIANSHSREKMLTMHYYKKHAVDIKELSAGEIDELTDQNAVQLIKRMGNIVIRNTFPDAGLQSMIISGMGNQYNQLRINNLPAYNQEVTSSAYGLEWIPAQALEQVNLQTISNASIPGEFAGGTVDLQFKTIPQYNFFYLQGGAAGSAGTTGKSFMGERRAPFNLVGFPGKSLDLPAGFPTTRSPSSLTQKNSQEQVYLSRQLPDHLGPVNYGAAPPAEKIMIGFGKLIQLKKQKKIGITAFLVQQSSAQVQNASVQIAPDVVNNPYPFNDPGKPLIHFQSQDTRYSRTTGLFGTLNAALLYGRNKISFQTILSNQLSSAYVNRYNMFKPDEDSAAHSGVYYSTRQRSSIIAQLSGEHALGDQGRFKFTWQFQYAYAYQYSPDERNFLLRQDSTNNNLYEIAHSAYNPFVPNINNVEATDPNLINTSRKWKELSDQQFMGAATIAAPFNLLHKTQVISGGIFIQNTYRTFHSDI